MNDFNIGFIGSLDGTKSKNKINQDIDSIKKSLKELELKVKINPNQIKAIESQLNTLKVNLTDVTISQNALNGLVAQINNALKGIQIPNINIGGSNGGNILGNNVAKLEEFRKSLSNIGMSSADIDAVAQRIERLNVDITSLNQSLSHTSGAKGDRNLLNIEVGGIDKFGQAIKLTQTWDMDLRELVKDVDAVSSATQKAGTSANNFVEKQKKAVTDLTNQINQIYKSAVDPNASKPIKSSTNLVNLENKYNDIITAIGKMGNASETTFADERNSVNTLISDLKIVIREYKNAETAATSMRSKDVGTIKSVKTNELDEFIAKIQNSKVPIKEMRTEISNLKTSLSSIHDTDSLTAYLNQFDIANSKFKSLKEQFAKSSSISSVIFNTSDLDRQGKVYIQRVRNTIETLKPELESKLRNAGYTDIEIKGVEDAKGKIKSLTATVTDATGAFKQLNFERAKIQGSGKAQAGFVQTDDVKVVGNISSAIEKAQGNLSSLKTKWEEQGILVGEFKTKVEQLESSLSSVGSKGELDNIKGQITSLKNEASTISQVNKIQLSMETGGYESKVDALVSKTRQWTDANGNARISTNELSKAFDQLTTASNNYTNSPTEAHQKTLIASEKELYKQIKIVTNSVRSMNSELAKDSAITSFRNQVTDFMSKNGKTVKSFQFGSELKDIFSKIQQGAKLSNQELAALKQRFISVQNVARTTGKLGKTWFQTLREGMSSFSYWTSSTFLVMKAIQSVKGGIRSIVELDTALVDLKKTTTMTASELEKFYYDSNKTAKQMGVTTKEILEQASAWSRLGFSSAEQATKMAKYSSMFRLISPGMDLASSTDGLVSVMKAFKIGLEDTDDVVDGIMSKINIIGNTQALNNSDIVDFLTRSSSAMAEANNSLDETIALGTAAVEITRDAASVGMYLPTNIVICC